MRYINIEDLSLPCGWQDKAQSVLDQLIVADPATRKRLIEKKAPLWGKLKNALSALSYNKCWYCDIEQRRSDNAVDHFRPKNRVANCDGHEGYWWLAFDWRNYRFSCTFCNSYRKDKETDGGKEDQFPLFNEDCRATKWSDDISLEQPKLLDPTNPADPELLWFYIDGTPTPKFSKDQNEVAYDRATTSIRLYHLNHEWLEEKRRTRYQQLSRLVERGNAALDDAVQSTSVPGKVQAQRRFASIVREIEEVISDRAELSSISRIFLRTFATSGTATQRNWVNQLLIKSQQARVNQ